MLVALGGTCQSPVAALAVPQGNGCLLRAHLFSEDGSVGAAACASLRDEAGAEAFGRQLLADSPAAVRALFAG